MSENRLAAKLTKVDKAAILLLSLGETDAAQVLRHMGPKEVQRVGVAMASMRNVHREQVEQVMGEFVEVVGDQTSLGVGADFAFARPSPAPSGRSFCSGTAYGRLPLRFRRSRRSLPAADAWCAT